MKIKVTWYKKTGKLYESCSLYITAKPIETHKIVKEIIEKQKVLIEDWWKPAEFYVTISNDVKAVSTPVNEFYDRLFTPEFIVGVMYGEVL